MSNGQQFIRTSFYAPLMICMCGSLATGQPTKDPFAVDTPRRTTVASPNSFPLAATAAAVNRAPSIDELNRKTEMALDVMFKSDYIEQRLADVLDELENELDVGIILHDSARENNLDEDTLIDLQIESRASSLLDMMLDAFDCTYAIIDGTIFVISRDQSQVESWLEFRDFDCSDVVRTQFDGDGEALVALLQELVESASWVENGGSARIRQVNGQLFVTQTSSNMRQLARILGRLQIKQHAQPN